MLLGILGGLFLTFSRPLYYLFGNQSQYFLYGLHLYDSNFITNDWFTWKVFHHDFAFGYLLFLLQKLGPLHITIVIAQLLIMIAFSFGLLILCKKFCKYPSLVFMVLITWMRLVSSAEIGLGGQYLIGGYLQPSEVAGPLMILGIALLLNHKFFSSGIFFGLAGLFHGAFLSSYGLAILITALATGFWRKYKSLLAFIAPLLLFWGIFFFVTIRAFSYSIPMTNKIASIMINLRAPGDFIISNWPFKWTLSWLMWTIMGLITIYKLRNKKQLKTLIICFFVVLLTNVLGIVQAIWLKIPTLTLMMLWRSSSLITILSALFVIDYGIDLILGNKKKLKQNIITIIIFFVCSLVLIYSHWGPQISRIHFLWLIAIPLSGLIGYFSKKINSNLISYKKTVLVFLSVIMLIIMAVYLRGYFGKSINYLTYIKPDTLADMEKWVRENTPSDAIFVVPLNMEYIRIRARRAVVVDWKSACYLPSDLQEWYQRLIDISGVSVNGNLPNNQDILNGYRQLDYKRAAFLAKKYNASYVVIENKKHLGSLMGLKEKYNNEDYQVLEIQKLY